MISFEKKVQAYITKHQLIKKDSHLLVACSGGVDSMALLHYLHKKKSEFHVQLSCVHVDHMLRGKQSYEDLLFVKKYCEEHDIPFYGKSIDIPSFIEKDGGNVQSVCRQQRYAYFEEVMAHAHAQILITAHHADDQIETILMSMTKNSSVKGLVGIEPIRTYSNFQIIRPFLSVTKDEIRGYLTREGQTWREDPSNEKDTYTRNRFRHTVVPALKAENAQLATNILQLSNQIREDDTLLMELAEEKFRDIVTKTDKNIYKFSIPDLKANPLALQRRLILILLNYIYGNSHTYQTYLLVDNILTLCEKQNGHAEIHLPEQFIVKRSYNTVRIEKETSPILLSSKLLLENEWQWFGKYKIWFGDEQSCSSSHFSPANVYYFSSTQIVLPLYVRSAKQGDRISLKGMNQAKRVSRIFIDEKIPKEERQYMPIIATKSDILIIGDLKHSHIISKSKRPNDDCVIVILDDSL